MNIIIWQHAFDIWSHLYFVILFIYQYNRTIYNILELPLLENGAVIWHPYQGYIIPNRLNAK